MIKLLIATSLVGGLLAGCATSKPMMGPSGSEAFFVKCGSAVLEACYEEAAKVCPKGYIIVDRQAGANAALIPSGNTMLLARGPNSMLVECKK